MLETPSIVDLTALPYAALRLVVPSHEIQRVMGPSIGEVFGAVAAQGLTPAGPWFTHHLRRPTDSFDFEVCVPVDRPIVAAGRVHPATRPAMRAARAVYQGPYEGLRDAWPRLFEWIASRGLTTTDDLWERYLVGPEAGADASAYRTELVRELR